MSRIPIPPSNQTALCLLLAITTARSQYAAIPRDGQAHSCRKAQPLMRHARCAQSPSCGRTSAGTVRPLHLLSHLKSAPCSARTTASSATRAVSSAPSAHPRTGRLPVLCRGSEPSTGPQLRDLFSSMFAGAGAPAPDLPWESALDDLQERFPGLNLRTFGQRQNNETIIAHHNRHRKDIMGSMLGHAYHMGFTRSRDVKPAFPTPALPPGRCRPTRVAQLQQQTTHRGRALRGVTVTEPIIMRSLQTVLQDEAGDLVTVHLYDVLPAEDTHSLQERWRAGEALFPKGTHLTILEPYFKLMADGTWGVRVDNPREVVHGPALLPGTSKEWAEEAAQHFEAADYNSAVHSYYQALELLQLEAAGSPATTSGTSNSSSSKPAGQGKPQAAATQLMISLLLNTAAAELRLQQPEAALCHATAAEALDPGNVKAHHKVALALDKLQQPLAARAAMEVAADLHTADLPASQRGAAKARLLGDLSEAARAAKWGKVQEAKGERLKLEVTVEALLGSLAAGSMKMGSASSSSSCCKEAAAAAAASSKEAGTASFKQENYSAALQHYKQGLEQLQGSFSAAAELLASRAECWLSLGQEHLNLAVTDAAAAALLNPQLVNAHVYLGRGLLQLQLLPAAEAAVAAALQLVPGDAQLQQLQQRVASAGGGKQQPAATAARGAAEGSYHTTEPAAATSSSGRSNAAATRATGGTTSSGPDIAAGGGASTRSGGSSSSSRAPSTASGTGFGSGSSSSSSRSSGSGSNKKKGKNKKAGPTGPRQPDVDAIRQGMLEEEGRMADVEQVALMNNLMGMAQQFGAQLPGGQAAVNNQVPAVHEEFARLGRWPAECDVEACRRRLRETYETARALPMHNTLLLHNRDANFKPEFLLKRLGPTSDHEEWKQRVEWWCKSNRGDVRFGPRLSYGVHSNEGRSNLSFHHSFNNTAVIGEFMTPGTTHVAVGFTDLSSAAAAVLQWEELGEFAGAGRSGVLRWVGYEASPVSVAKALVVTSMMLGGEPEEAVMQVWYSSAWSRSTLTAFQRATTTVLAAAADGSRSSTNAPSSGGAAAAVRNHQQLWRESLTPAVVEVLRLWQQQEVALSTSRKEWLANDKQAHVQIMAFKQQADRMAMAEYMLTGQLGEAAVGSTTMFVLPPGTMRMPEEDVLKTLPFDGLMKERLQRGTPDIMAAAQQLLLRRIRALAVAVRTGRVTLQAHHAEVSPGATRLLASIKALSPWTMSWSNLADYLTPQEFHSMARACSGDEDTVHYMHTMNWVRDIKGACHLDWILDARDVKQQAEIMTDLLKVNAESTAMFYGVHGWNRLLHPPVDNPRNLVDAGLAVGFHKVWVEAFFKHAGMPHPDKQVFIYKGPLHSQLARACTTTYVAFSYDPAVKLQVGLTY